jgi:hypothetical protein
MAITLVACCVLGELAPNLAQFIQVWVVCLVLIAVSLA